MKFSAQLDVAMVAHETTDEVTVMLDMVAPAPTVTEQPRTPSSLQVVLDRSGSMAGERLAGALDALERLVARLDASDNFGVVVFDNHAAVAVPAGPLHDKQRVVEQLRRIRPGGSTDLSSGYLRGLQELRRVAGESGGTLLVISDGHVNSGVTDPVRFGEIAATARRQQVVTSTLGLGLGYDESLLVTLADAGSGNHHFAEDRDQAGALIASEVDHLLDKAVQAASLVVELSPEVQLLRLYNDLPAQLPNSKLLKVSGAYPDADSLWAAVRTQLDRPESNRPRWHLAHPIVQGESTWILNNNWGLQTRRVFQELIDIAPSGFSVREDETAVADE